MCSGSVVVTTSDCESGRPGSSPERVPIAIRLDHCTELTRVLYPPGLHIGTRAAEHKGCNWGMQLIDGSNFESYVFGHTFCGMIWHMPQK